MGLACAILVAGFARPAPAQRVTGPWEDATLAPHGVLRVGISPRFANWRERFSRADGTREPLGADFTRDSLGTSFFPFIAGLGPGLSTLTGLTSPALSLGSMQTSLEVTEVTTSISLDFGLTNRIGLQALIPYVKNHVYVSANANPGGAGATLGFNPGLLLAGARTQNEAVTTSLGAAASTLTSELTRCASLTDPTCTAINADREGAMTLVQLATDVSDAIGTVFGTSAVTGSIYAPVAGSALHAAVDARLADLNTRFQSFLGAPTAGEWVNGRPVPAPPMAAAEFATFLGDPAYGISARPLGDFEHSHVGDIEVGAKIQLLDTFGPPATAALPRTGAIRLAVAGIYRLPTGQLDLPDNFIDLGAGQKQADLEVRGFADLALGARFWTSAVVRFGMQQPDRLIRRITDHAGDPFPELAREQDVERNLGDIVEMELAPRWVPNDEFAFSGIYRYRSKSADTYSGSFQVTSADGTPLSLDASTLGLGTAQTEQMMGFAITYSTVRGHARRQARWPLEVSFVHTEVVSGKGVTLVRANALSLRWYRWR